MATIKIKRGDTAFKFQDVLTVDGAPVDMTGATVSFIIKGVDNGVLFKRTANPLTPAAAGDPNVEYDPVADDTKVAGSYQVEWEVVFTGGKVLTFPQGSYNTLVILNDLG